MLHPRRFLPSLSLLAAFESAARHGSISAAARELSLTQSAVSRQIKALEEQLEVALFHRERQTIRLTIGGEGYVREIRDALGKISSASLNLRANPSGRTLNIAVLPTFGARWLIPRLAAFVQANPGVRVNLITRQTHFDFRLEPIDVAIHFGRGEWAGGELVFLRQELVLPVCAPGLRSTYDFRRPEDLRQAPLMHLTSRLRAWEEWLSYHGASDEGLQGMLFDQFISLIEAAVAGVGLALLPVFLIRSELERGTLVPALDLPMESPGAYYLVWPEERGGYGPLVAFREWLLAEINADL